MVDVEGLDLENLATRRQQRLRWVRWVALVDFVLLVLLVAASLTGARAWVSILGPLHGGNFLLLLTIVGVGAVDGLWGWWFLWAVLLTAGPIGAFVGEWLLGRQAKQGNA